jgi:hypothetical protein
MKKTLLLSVGIAAFLVQSASAQTTFYSQNFEGFANGNTGPDNWYTFAGGGGTSTPTYGYVTNYLGSQVYQVTWDSSLDGASYQYAGIGNNNGLIPASSGYSFSQITISIDLAENGSTSPNAFAIYLDQYNPGQTWQEQYNPTTTIDGSFTDISFTLAQGTSASGTYDPTLPIFVGIDNNSGFPDAAGNQLVIDNVSVTAVPEPVSLALFGLGAAGLLAMRRRKA